MDSDKQAITELCYYYARAVDRRRFQSLRELMAANCSLTAPGISLTGVEEIIAGMAALDQYKSTSHAVYNCLIEVSNDTASGEIYCQASHIYDDEQGVEKKLDWGLRYLDQYQKSNDQWQFTQRQLVIDWTQDLPTNRPQS